MPGCIFCGKTPTTKTHVFRKAWIQEIMGGDVEGGFFIHHHARSGEGSFDVTWEKTTFDIQPHAACRDCNSEWMNQLEHMGEALITPCVLGHGRTFSANTHATLARWILVCMVVLEQTQKTRRVRQETCDVLRREWEPPTDCIVWVAATPDASNVINGWPRAWELESPGDPTHGYFCTFRIKHFVAQGFISLDRPTKDFEFDRSGGTAEHVRQLWPSYGGEVVWPPPKLVRADQLEEFSRVFES